MNQTQSLETLERYVRARYPLVAILSYEENRVLAGIKTVAAHREYQVAVWSATQGLQDLPGVDPEVTRDPIPAFDAMLQYDLSKPTLFVMLDLHGLLGDRDHGFQPIIVRYLRDVAAHFEKCRHTLVLVSPAFQIPPDLEKSMALIDWPLPDGDELATILRKMEMDMPAKFPITLNGNRETVVQALRGLTAFEAESVLASGIVATRELGESVIPFIVKEKAQIIRKSGVLEFYDTSVTMSQVGGLQYLKHYAAVKRAAFSAEAAAAGVDAPRGVILVGVPGTGKSLSAKAIAGGQMPLLRMDVGALMGGLVGQSESNMRQALKVAEAVAPCVLWIDEIEKALGGLGGENDGGTSARVFGTLLTWMQETPAPVYVVATANDARTLKPELLRRFDDIFWVDLPNREARKEIASVHLSRRGQDPAGFDLDALAESTWGFTGAEVEKVVKSAIETAFFQHTALKSDHLLAAAARIIPIGVTMKDKIEELRNWARNRAVEAADPLEPRPVLTNQSRTIDL